MREGALDLRARGSVEELRDGTAQDAHAIEAEEAPSRLVHAEDLAAAIGQQRRDAERLEGRAIPLLPRTHRRDGDRGALELRVAGLFAALFGARTCRSARGADRLVLLHEHLAGLVSDGVLRRVEDVRPCQRDSSKEQTGVLCRGSSPLEYWTWTFRCERSGDAVAGFKVGV
jgi:hypothetical protein